MELMRLILPEYIKFVSVGCGFFDIMRYVYLIHILRENIVLKSSTFNGQETQCFNRIGRVPLHDIVD